MARSALETGARQIRKKYVPLLIEHDFNRQIGVLLNAKVAKLPDGEFALLRIRRITHSASSICGATSRAADFTQR